MSDTPNSEGVALTATEAANLALRVASRHLRTDWLEWEDVPFLGEHAFSRLLDAMEHLADKLAEEASTRDRVCDVDSGDLLSQAINGKATS